VLHASDEAPEDDLARTEVLWARALRDSAPSEAARHLRQAIIIHDAFLARHSTPSWQIGRAVAVLRLADIERDREGDAARAAIALLEAYEATGGLTPEEQRDLVAARR